MEILTKINTKIGGCTFSKTINNSMILSLKGVKSMLQVCFLITTQVGNLYKLLTRNKDLS